MAALSASHLHFLNSQSSILLRNKGKPRSGILLLCCQNQDPSDPSDSSESKAKKEKEIKKKILSDSQGFILSFEKIGKELKEKLRPQKKGDWKDVTLMSLSFAVYVYISQKLVCAYCLWMSMPKQIW